MEKIQNLVENNFSAISEYIHKAYIFGSYARGSNRYNDIDILVVCDDVQYSRVVYELEGMNFQREVFISSDVTDYKPIPMPPFPFPFPKPKREAIPFHITVLKESDYQSSLLKEKIQDEKIKICF